MPINDIAIIVWTQVFVLRFLKFNDIDFAINTVYQAVHQLIVIGNCYNKFQKCHSNAEG